MTDYPKSNARATAAQAEKQALELLSGSVGDPSPEQLGWASEEPPSLDPEARAHSRLEAGLLLDAALDPASASSRPVPLTSVRAGYAIVGHRSSDDARVHPRLAEALAAGRRESLRDQFADLWAVDWRTWEQLETGESRAISIAWLTSPGRRLLSDLDVLRVLRDDPPVDWDPGPTDLTCERLRAAIGLGASTHDQDDWTELHAAIPGSELHNWAPRSRENQVPLVIDLLERGAPPMVRGAALTWLLNRAVDSPIYSFEELTRDLRQDLPVRLAAAFATEGQLAEFHHVSRRLEATLLQHVACMAATRLQDWTTSELWHLARWLHGALIRSPWFGGDLPALVERLRAHLPSSPPALDPALHPLHPRRFRDAEDDAAPDGIDAEDLAMVTGALGHFVGQRATWTPAPRTLVQELRRIARHSLNEGERHAEAAMLRLCDGGSDEMGWNQLSRHLAPSLAARWLLSHLHTGWMKDAVSAGCDASVVETLELLEADPNHYEWLCFAWMEEGPELPAHLRNRALNTWMTLARTEPSFIYRPAALGAGLLDIMSPNLADEVIDQAQSAAPPWRVNLLNILAERLPPDTAHWNAVIDLLLAQATKPGVNEKERVDAAVLVLRRLSAIRDATNRERLQKIADLTDRPPFSQHVGLRRELRRLGFHPRRTAEAG